MGLTIKFGILKNEDDGNGRSCDWPGKIFEWDNKNGLTFIGEENEGTDFTISFSSGRPYRDMTYSDADNWGEAIPEVAMFLTNWSFDEPFVPLDGTIMSQIDAIPLTGDELDIDKAKWLKYWSRRAVEEFGNDAIIGFC